MQNPLFYLKELEKKLGYTFKKKYLAYAALQHKSGKVTAAYQSHNFERLEFLGDRVLNLVISQWLYKNSPLEAESHLALRLNNLINREALYVIAQKMNIERHIHFDKNNLKTKKILADSVEALLGALFLDSSFNVTQKLVLKLWSDLLDIEIQHPALQDSKSALQDWTQKNYKTLPKYTLLRTTGPAHAPILTVELAIDQKNDAKKPLKLTNQGASRREIEQSLAKQMLKKLMRA